jgi:YVTN family beta-propeller protein
MYLADQGHYFGQPASSLVYKIDLREQKIVSTISAGTGPHGVVTSHDGSRVFVTNIVSGDVSIIDTATDTERTRIPVGSEPNGISIWSETLGGTP